MGAGWVPPLPPRGRGCGGHCTLGWSLLLGRRIDVLEVWEEMDGKDGRGCMWVMLEGEEAGLFIMVAAYGGRGRLAVGGEYWWTVERCAFVVGRRVRGWTGPLPPGGWGCTCTPHGGLFCPPCGVSISIVWALLEAGGRCH